MGIMETVYAYLAGIIDSDGYVTVAKSNKNRVVGNAKWTYRAYAPRIGITGTRPAPHRLAAETFGGTPWSRQPDNPQHRLAHYWTISGPAATSALRLMLPYLLVKQEQAVLAIELGELITAQFAEIRATRKPPYKVPEEMLAERERLWAAVTVLNEPRNRRVHFAPTSG